MTRSSKYIKAWTSFRTAEERFRHEKYWKDLEAEDERRQLFDEYIHDLQRKEKVSVVFARLQTYNALMTISPCDRPPKENCTSET
jgi:hypothetical protein